MGVKRDPVGISLRALTKFFPLEVIEEILEGTGRGSVRLRRLPAPLMMYYVVALALFFSAGSREVLRRVSRARPNWPEEYDDVSSESAICQARNSERVTSALFGAHRMSLKMQHLARTSFMPSPEKSAGRKPPGKVVDGRR